MTVLPRSVLFVLAAVFSTAAYAASATSGKGSDPVNRAVEAMGGAAALGQLKTVEIRGTNVARENESSLKPGKEAELRQGAESKFHVRRDLSSGNARIDWQRTVTRTPKPLIQNYSEILVDGIGYVSGVDSTSRTQFSVKSNPPGHPMSGARAAVTLRELARQSPRLLLDMQNDRKAVKTVAAQAVDGKKLPAVRYDVRNWSFIVMFDPHTGLPERIRTLDGDPIQGDSNYDLVLADWRPVGGAKVAHNLTYKLNGNDMVSIKYDQVTPNPALGPELFEIPITARAVAVRASLGSGIPYQWMIRRGYWGNLMDSDTVGWDVGAMAEPTLVDIATGVSVSQGVSHNSMVVDMDKFLVVFDAPINEQFSEWMIKASKERYPGKPIKYLILTHHHWDHTSGTRTYAAEGATVVVGKGAKEHFSRTVSAPGTALSDRLSRAPRKASVVEVDGKYVLKGGKREVHAYLIESEHSIGTLIGWVPDAKLGFVTDIWSNNAPLPPKPTAGHREVVAGVKKWGLAPERFAHGHGNPSEYAPFAKFAGD